MQIKKRLAAVFAVCALALSVATPAMAVPAGADTSGSEPATYQVDNIFVTKQLESVKGVTLDEEFKFTVAENKAIEGARQGEYPKLPTIGNAKITLDGNQADVDANNFVHRYAQGKVDLSMFTSEFAKAHPGLYAYTISETAGSTQYMDYDSNTYTLRVYCKNDGTLQVTVENNATNEKVDPSKKSDQDLTAEKMPELASFKNKYMVSDKPNNPDQGKKQNLVISKVVNAGEYGFTNQEFTVKIKFHKPGQVIDTDYTEFKLNGATQTLEKTFENLPVGTTYEIVEVKTPEWKGEGTATTTASVTTKTTSVAKTDENVTLNSLIGKDAGNKVEFTNTFDKNVSITGLALNNAPFILMIGIPVVAGIAWVARRRSSQN